MSAQTKSNSNESSTNKESKGIFETMSEWVNSHPFATATIVVVGTSMLVAASKSSMDVKEIEDDFKVNLDISQRVALEKILKENEEKLGRGKILNGLTLGLCSTKDEVALETKENFLEQFPDLLKIAEDQKIVEDKRLKERDALSHKRAVELKDLKIAQLNSETQIEQARLFAEMKENEADSKARSNMFISSALSAGAVGVAKNWNGDNSDD